jgi:hypothetical protein
MLIRQYNCVQSFRHTTLTPINIDWTIQKMSIFRPSSNHSTALICAAFTQDLGAVWERISVSAFGFLLMMMLHTPVWHLYFSFACPKEKYQKKRAVLRAEWNCAVFARRWWFSSHPAPVKKGAPSFVGPIPFTRACAADGLARGHYVGRVRGSKFCLLLRFILSIFVPDCIHNSCIQLNQKIPCLYVLVIPIKNNNQTSYGG